MWSREPLRRGALAYGTAVASYLGYGALRLTSGSATTVSAIERAARSWPGADPPAAEPLPSFVVLLPMLREDRLIGDVCRHLLPAARSNAAIDVVVITSEREAQERDAAQHALRSPGGQPQLGGRPGQMHLAVTAQALPQLESALRAGDRPRVDRLLEEHRRPTTAEVARPLLATLNGELGRQAFHHVVVAADNSSKVAKLNRALAQWLPRRKTDPRATYVAVYDADSLPDLRSFALVGDEVARRSMDGASLPSIFQQVSCYCRNLRSLTGMRGLVSLADAIAQTRWALGFEYPLYRRYAAAVSTGRLRPLVYCVGHGCFVSLDFLERIGGFPSLSPTDDLALGYIASALGVELVPVPALDYCEVAPDPVLSMRQSRFWFSGSARFWRDLRYARGTHRPPMTTAQWTWLHAEGLGRNAAWAGRGAAWCSALALAVATRQWRLAGALALAHVAYVQGGYVQTVRALRRLPGASRATGIHDIPRWRLVGGCIAASGSFILRSIGPLGGAAEAARRRTAGEWKLER
jgi:hypothetical protein